MRTTASGCQRSALLLMSFQCRPAHSLLLRGRLQGVRSSTWQQQRPAQVQPCTSLRQGQQQQLVRQGSPVAARLGPARSKRLLLLRQPYLQSKQVTRGLRSWPCQMQRRRTMVPALPLMHTPRQAHQMPPLPPQAMAWTLPPRKE